MEIIVARRIAINLMVTHLTNGGHPGWTLTFNNNKTSLAQCSNSRRRIELSRHFVDGADEDSFRNTMLHEIAHALTPGHHHDSVWRAKHIALGGNGARTGNMVINDWLYIGNCKCGHQFKAHRLGKRLKNGIHAQGCRTPVMWRNTRTGEISLLGRPVLDPANVVW